MAQRLSREEMLMEHARVAAQRGSCSRLQVGAVFARDGRIIATGYNGTAKDQPHCSHECNCDEPIFHRDDCWSQKPCLTAQHAERNGIDFAARHGLSLLQSELYVTHMPCLHCSSSLINVGIQQITFAVPYRLTDGVELLARAGILVLTQDQVSGKVDIW